MPTIFISRNGGMVELSPEYVEHERYILSEDYDELRAMCDELANGIRYALSVSKFGEGPVIHAMNGLQVSYTKYVYGPHKATDEDEVCDDS